ncbi:MAG: Gfo/Idh/MocA family oxidoreductase [Lachnospiraceae bacterium]|jgi:predicted dehydrogenase|nr:Gfo/Idh/MocA family oxidoreductase [Lachnospiraceae bacterium]MCH4070988.1 Gfo/Idh/MocA family oxidoreductase [Lachnospiraceae bacterium]MCH4107975.1 Gfo/Idh/MocA family oxidoreductase [Lachnospiraceae bacterium]MCI1302443.1 Gfo/Idh/MocA family oxidoreductase [Lachnospiraceae bacterium]MCI1332584.1 Gfo/Idh/MocA family oxidoreductase [Lachnospiraceae bacterium]
MSSKSDGMNYAPKGKPAAVVGPGEFKIAAMHLDHGHIYGMCNGLTEAGAEVKWVYDPDPEKVKAFQKAFPNAKAARSEEEVFEDPEVKLVAGAHVTSERCALGLRAMAAGKDYFTDKAPLTTLAQLQAAKDMVKKTGRKYMVYYSERIHVEAAVYAGYLVEQGVIGRPIHVDGFGPHRVGNPKSRPDWFFEKEKYGGILCDIGSHQIEQFLYYCGVKDANVQYSEVGNYNHPDHPGLEDFGDAVLVGDNGTTQHFRVDWFTPEGLSTWGDGRTFIIGTDGYIELRKYVNVATQKTGNHVFLVNKDGEQHFEVDGLVGYPYFGQLILDCLNRTENAMTQDHAFKAAELSVKAEMMAKNLTPIIRK